jgi:hypothetical protein
MAHYWGVWPILVEGFWPFSEEGAKGEGFAVAGFF